MVEEESLTDDTSPFPWHLKACSGQGFQFLIESNDGDTVAMIEMYRKDDVLALSRLFTRNPEFRIDEDFASEVRRMEFCRVCRRYCIDYDTVDDCVDIAFSVPDQDEAKRLVCRLLSRHTNAEAVDNIMLAWPR